MPKDILQVGPLLWGSISLVKSLLGLDPRRNEFIGTGEPRHTPKEMSVVSRYMQEIQTKLSAGVDVPEEDIAKGSATRVPAVGGVDTRPLIHIYSGPAPPGRRLHGSMLPELLVLAR
jgi:hypothetical protein